MDEWKWVGVHYIGVWGEWMTFGRVYMQVNNGRELRYALDFYLFTEEILILKLPKRTEAFQVAFTSIY